MPIYSDPMNRLLRTCILICITITPGCHTDVNPAPSGTPGILLAGTHPLKDVQITVYSEESGEQSDPRPLAFGITDDGGRFSLQAHDSLSGFQLPAGNYRITLESVGEFQLVWPAEFASAQKTPLRKSWSSADAELVLDVPEPQIVL